MELYCPACGIETPYPEGTDLCPRHDSSLEEWRPPVDGSDQESSGAVKPLEGPECEETDPDHCWNCDTAVPVERNSECLKCKKSLTPPAVQLRFPHGDIELGLGEETVLGRVGPHADVFREHANVSRRHARVGVEGSGGVWIEPRSDAVNGTFINWNELGSGRHPVRTRARLRLARDVDCAVRVFRVAPDPPTGGTR
jgi:hypothetical protein